MTSGAGRPSCADSSIGRFARSPHHRASAARVDVHHPHAESRRRGDGTGYGVRNVVELQIEKDAVAARDQLFDDRWAVAGEQAAADLESADRAAKPIGEAPRVIRRVDVERD